jgi:hypothetical protein
MKPNRDRELDPGELFDVHALTSTSAAVALCPEGREPR